MNDVLTEPRAGTVGSLERRVDKLESVVNGLVVDVAVIKTGQANQTNLMTSQHASLIGQLNSLAGELRGFIASASQQSGDPSATPAGRAILSAISERDERRAREHKAFEEAIQAVAAKTNGLALKVAAIGGGITVVWAVILVLAPAIRKALGLP